MLSTTFPESQAIPEASTRRYSAQLTDAVGQVLSSAQIISIRFSLHDARSNAVINDRYHQEVLNANGGMLSPTAFFTFVLNPFDTVAIGSAKLQKRRALFEITYEGGVENHEVFFFVQNLIDLPLRPQEDLHVADSILVDLGDPQQPKDEVLHVVEDRLVVVLA